MKKQFEVDMSLLAKVFDNVNCGYCLCKIDVTCPCEEIYVLEEGKSCSCGVYRCLGGELESEA